MKKKTTKKKKTRKKSNHSKSEKKYTKEIKGESPKIPKSIIEKSPIKKISVLNFNTESEIAMDFATKAYQKFNKIIKSIILFGSIAKKDPQVGSDIDIIIIIDDVSVKWDQELIAWYREELEKLLRANPYKRELHINTTKLSTWWEDLIKGDPTVLNILRYGESMIDFAGFFEPLKYLLVQGKIKSTPEAVYNCLLRAPKHYARSKAAELSSIEGLYWSMVDSAHAALISANILPPSPEHIAKYLKETFVDKGKLKVKYAIWFRDLYSLHKQIAHGEVKDIKSSEIDEWQTRTKEFLDTMVKLVNEMIS